MKIYFEPQMNTDKKNFVKQTFLLFFRTASSYLSKEQGKDLNWLFEIRSVGDYGGAAHVSQSQAHRNYCLLCVFCAFAVN